MSVVNRLQSQPLPETTLSRGKSIEHTIATNGVDRIYRINCFKTASSTFLGIRIFLECMRELLVERKQ